MQETGSHSAVQLDFALGYTEIKLHAARRWWHFQISVAVAKITFPSFHLACFAGFNGKIQNSVIILICLLAHKHRFFFQQHFQHWKYHTCLCAPIYFNSDEKDIKACTKCATACHKYTQHKLDQLFSSCHEHTDQSVESVSVHRCCCFLYCYSNVPPQSCVLQVCQTARKAQLASSVLSGILSTCSDYSEDVDTDASVFSLSLQAEGRTPPYYKNKA